MKLFVRFYHSKNGPQRKDLYKANLLFAWFGMKMYNVIFFFFFETFAIIIMTWSAFTIENRIGNRGSKSVTNANVRLCFENNELLLLFPCHRRQRV